MLLLLLSDIEMIKLICIVTRQLQPTATYNNPLMWSRSEELQRGRRYTTTY